MRVVKTAWLILTLTIWLSFGQQVDACLMHDLSLDSQHRAYANESVGGLFTQTESGIWSLTGGVKINDNWVITAAHTIDNTGEPYGIYFGENAWSPIQSSLVDAYYVHPDWNGVNSHDLTLLHLSNPLTEIPTAAISGYQPAGGQHLQFTGYGLHGTEHNPAEEQDGFRRGWEGEVTQFGDPGKVPSHEPPAKPEA
jgi:hypothetical protein